MPVGARDATPRGKRFQQREARAASAALKALENATTWRECEGVEPSPDREAGPATVLKSLTRYPLCAS